jgi:type IV pilus assembly protein PilA
LESAVPHRHSGFTLIEVMIVVAIIGLLGSIASVQYVNYVTKSKWRAAYAESAAVRNTIELAVVGGDSLVLKDMHVFDTTSHCSNRLDGNATVGLNFVCTVTGGPANVAGGTISMARAASGSWSCTSSVKQQYVGDVTLCTGQ